MTSQDLPPAAGGRPGPAGAEGPPQARGLAPEKGSRQPGTHRLDGGSRRLVPPAAASGTSRRRPEPSGPWLANLPYMIVLVGAFGGLLWVYLSQTHVKGGILTISASFLAAAVARLMLPVERVGLLINRRRAIDVAAFALLAAGLLAGALLIPSPS